MKKKNSEEVENGLKRTFEWEIDNAIRSLKMILKDDKKGLPVNEILFMEALNSIKKAIDMESGKKLKNWNWDMIMTEGDVDPKKYK